MKLYIVSFENYREDDEFVLFEEDEKDIVKAAYLPNIKYFDKEDIEDFKRKFGIDLVKLSQEGKSIGYIKEKLEEAGDYDTVEEIDDFLDSLSYLPQCCPSPYCEDIVEKKDIEELEKEGALFYDTSNDALYSVLSDIDFDEYYIFWDGRNHRALRILGDKEEKEVEEVEDKWNRDGNTYHYLYYKDPDDDKVISVFVSHYQGEIPLLDKEFNEKPKIAKKKTKKTAKTLKI